MCTYEYFRSRKQQAMRKIPLLFFIILGCNAVLYAQKNGTAKGIAFDSLAQKSVSSATISVLDKKDSSLVTFTMTDNTGRFSVSGLANGEYRLLISHVNYHNSATTFKITDETKNADLGNIILTDKNQMLPEVIVTNEAPPITLVDDTVQYNAGSFKTVPNATVEQLLKKLPGVQVDKDGTIKAQGETVSRVLVNGKEFFGNDPKIATRNLTADLIDKVQVYDKQSDQAQLTGFDDGNYEKTINLKLKKDKSQGVFGKVMAGAGNKDRYEGRFNLNSFKGARQVSAIGMGNNTNAEGFSFNDILSFSGALSQLQRGSAGAGTINISSSQASSLGMNAAQSGGINTAWAGGINYNNIIGNKLDWQSSYFYNRYNPKSESHVLRQNILGNTTSFYKEDANTNNLNNSQRFNINALYQIDSMHSIRFTPNISYQKTSNQSYKTYQTNAANGDLVNQGFSNSLSNSDGYNFSNEILFRKKFARKGRTLSVTLNTSLNESNGDGSLSSIVNYYTNGVATRKDTVNQQNTSNSDLRGYNAKAVYTEPLWKRSLLEFSAGKSYTQNTSQQKTYDYNTNTKNYDKINAAQTNDYENGYGFTNAGIRLRTQKGKTTWSLGLNWQEAELKGKIISGVKDSVITKSFKNLLPNASFRYNFTRFKSFTLNYSASTNQPSMTQLQPVPDITNPLYIKEGNPDLKQEFTQSFRGNLNLISPYSGKNLFLFFTASTTQNKIVNNDSVNLQTGIRRTRYTNVDGVYNLNGSLSYSLPIRFVHGTIEVSNNIGYNKGKQFINNSANSIQTLSMGPQLRFDINPYEKLNMAFSAQYNYNKTNYSLQSSLNNKYFSQAYNASADWQLPASFMLGTSFAYTINSQRATGFNIKVPIWNANISKQMLKNNRGELKLSAYDLLNRNTGITRNTNQNYIEDQQVNTLRRFFMLSFTYSLSKAGLNNAGAPGGMRVIMR